MALLKVNFFLLLFAVPIVASANRPPQVKVACIGASITYGATIQNREQNCYPAQLERMLGDHYTVKNYGVSGTTLLKNGNNPYYKTREYQDALDFRPDVVVIDLGGNDAKLINRGYYSEFVKDYAEMISSFSQLPSHPRIILLLAMASFVTDTTGIWDPVIVRYINPRIQNVAFENGVEVIDMHSAFIDQSALVPDQIHPNAAGATIMARRVFDVMSKSKESAFDIFTALPQPNKISSFYGYQCASFNFEGRDCKVVKPKAFAKNHPWIWRARFWGHEPQADIALLEQGFHVVYCDVAELLGNDEAIRHWDHFYSMLTKAGLSKKVALEGMSRGGVYVFNWAAANPEKVSAVYVDNPVLDLKSWPGGLGRAMKSPQEREDFKKDFKLKTEEDIKKFSGSPMDKIKQIVKGKYPILIVCADADEAVPIEENTQLFEKKVKEMNGNITVIYKPGFKHHPHSFPNPILITDFILKATD